MNPLWMSQAIPTINPYIPTMMVPQPSQITQTPPVQNTIQVQPQPSQPQPIQSITTWNWKVVKDYQSMLQESIPFDGTPVLFMLSDSSTFYIVNMVDGKKMVNGYEFTPLTNSSYSQDTEPELTPEELTEQRFSKLENSLASLASKIEKLVEVHSNESDIEVIEPETTEIIQRKPIK